MEIQRMCIGGVMERAAGRYPASEKKF